ncbi:MAG: hypothetical protein U5P41_11100 [Gammaproteobacteria bacterium]|nr:hypothetical protein [Gammaproteobacteria bacterium]
MGERFKVMALARDFDGRLAGMRQGSRHRPPRYMRPDSAGSSCCLVLIPSLGGWRHDRRRLAA